MEERDRGCDLQRQERIQLFRCDWKGKGHFDAKVLWSVIAYNIRVMTSLLLDELTLQSQ